MMASMDDKSSSQSDPCTSTDEEPGELQPEGECTKPKAFLEDKDEVTIKETVIQQTVTTEVKQRELKAVAIVNNDTRRHSAESRGSQPPTPTPSSFGLDMSSTLPPLPAPMESKYKKALRKLYTQLPEYLHKVDVMANELFALFTVTESELDQLRATQKTEGRILHAQKLIDILRTKSDEEIEGWLNLLDTNLNQPKIANWIRDTADKCVEESMQLQRQTSVQRNAKKRARRSSDSEDETDHKQPKLDLDLILRTVPPPSSLDAFNSIVAKQLNHLLISIKYKSGSDDIITYLKQHLHKLKSEVFDETETPCSCQTVDARTEQTKSCAAMVSVGFLGGEKEAFELLESKLPDFESYVIQQKAQLVAITEGCIRMKLSVNNLCNLESLCDDLRSGDFLCRITDWLHDQGYVGTDDRPAFMLLADDFQIQKLRETLSATPDRPKRRIKHIKTLMESVERSLKHPKHDLDLIIRTIPKSTCTSEDDLSDIATGNQRTVISRRGPLLMSVKYLRGSDEVTGYVKHSIYKMKSQVSKTLNVPCACITEDQRKTTDETSSALVSVGFEAGEKEAYNILEANMDDFEEYVLKKTATVVRVIEGCIKITIRVTEKKYVKALYQDLQSGDLLDRIVSWLLQKGYKSSVERPALLLTVDEMRIKEMMSQQSDEYSDAVASKLFSGKVVNKLMKFEEWNRKVLYPPAKVLSPICCV